MTAKHKGAAGMWLVNVVGNAVLLAACYFWLLLPDAHGYQVAGSVALAIAVIFFGLWLRTATFAYFRIGEFRETAALGRAFHHALRHMVALAVWLLPFSMFALMLFWLQKYAPQFGVWFWQKLPSALRVGSPRQMMHAAYVLLWLLFGFALMMWLPMASTVAAAGLDGPLMLRALRILKRGSYWLWFWLLVLIGGWIPYELVWWIPNLADLRQQAWSAGLRLTLAYIVLISAWIALLLVVGEWVEKEDPEPIPVSTPAGVSRSGF